MKACKDPSMLAQHAASSTSCGRYQRYNYTHCGRCIPCQIRRAAFVGAGVEDATHYHFDDLAKLAGFDADDVRSVAMARLTAEQDGLESWIGSSLSSPHIQNRGALRSMIGRGLDELGALHSQFARSRDRLSLPSRPVSRTLRCCRGGTNTGHWGPVPSRPPHPHGPARRDSDSTAPRSRTALGMHPQLAMNASMNFTSSTDTWQRRDLSGKSAWMAHQSSAPPGQHSRGFSSIFSPRAARRKASWSRSTVDARPLRSWTPSKPEPASRGS